MKKLKKLKYGREFCPVPHAKKGGRKKFSLFPFFLFPRQKSSIYKYTILYYTILYYTIVYYTISLYKTYKNFFQQGKRKKGKKENNIYKKEIPLIYGSKITLIKIKFLTIIFFSLIWENSKRYCCPEGQKPLKNFSSSLTTHHPELSSVYHHLPIAHSSQQTLPSSPQHNHELLIF